MHRLIVAFILTTILLCPSYEQEVQSKILWDGYDWEKYKGEVGDIIKVTYLIGLYHGQIENSNNIYDALAIEFSWKEPEIEQLMTYVAFGSGLSLGGAKWAEVIENVDHYYKDNANKKIPVCSLATFVSRKLRGELSPEKAAEELLRLRVFYSKPRSIRIKKLK
jgi:hypothetical protein